MIRRIVLTTLGAAAGLFVLIQFVPYRASNPPVTQTPVWNTAETEQLARRACYDCHSNEVVVPWYGHVAPVAWAVRRHVDEGRSAMNLSELDRPQEEAHEAGEAVLEGEMPPRYYLVLHPEARLTDAERRTLAAGLDATLGSEDRGGHGEEAHRGDGGDHIFLAHPEPAARLSFGEHDDDDGSDD